MSKHDCDNYKCRACDKESKGGVPPNEPILFEWHIPMLPVYCSGCDNTFYKKHPHKLNGRGHMYVHDGTNPLMFRKALEEWSEAWLKWLDNDSKPRFKSNRGGKFFKDKGGSITEEEYNSQDNRGASRTAFMKYNTNTVLYNKPILNQTPYIIRREYVDGTVKIIPKFPDFTAGDLLNFVYFYLLKRTYNGGKSSDQEIWNKDFKGEDILEDMANTTILEFYERTAKGVEIKSLHGFLATLAGQALSNWRKDRAQQKLTTIPHSVLSGYEDIDNPYELYDLYAASKTEEHADSIDLLTKLIADIDKDAEDLELKKHALYKLMTTDPQYINTPKEDLQGLLDEVIARNEVAITKGMKRAALNALLGKNKGLQGNKQTRKQLRAFRRAIESYADRPDVKELIDLLAAKSLEVADTKLEQEFEVTRW